MTEIHDTVTPAEDPSFHALTLVLTSHGFASRVELDGRPLKGVRNIRVECGIDAETRTYIEIITPRVAVEAGLTCETWFSGLRAGTSPRRKVSRAIS